MAKAEIRWVTHAGKHIPINVGKSSTAKSGGNKAVAKGEQSGPNVAQPGVGKGINGKIQLAKKDELKNLKGPKTKGGKK